LIDVVDGIGARQCSTVAFLAGGQPLWMDRQRRFYPIPGRSSAPRRSDVHPGAQRSTGHCHQRKVQLLYVTNCAQFKYQSEMNTKRPVPLRDRWFCMANARWKMLDVIEGTNHGGLMP
jgi:hypothetical protein